MVTIRARAGFTEGFSRPPPPGRRQETTAAIRRDCPSNWEGRIPALMHHRSVPLWLAVLFLPGSFCAEEPVLPGIGAAMQEEVSKTQVAVR